jgi:putative ABC transport system permease protein
MSLLDVLVTSLTALRSNILRTLLTMLGIIIGISAVITLTAAGEGAQQGVSDQIRGLGSNLMFVRPGAPSSQGGAAQIPGSGPSLFFEDANAIGAANLPYIDSIASQGTVGGAGSIISAQVIYRGQNVSTVLAGTEPSYQSVRDFYVQEGRFISEDDITKKALTTVLGSHVAEKLFGTSDPIGESVRIFAGVGRFGFGFNFTVIGVMETKGASATGDQDDLVFVPLPSFQARVPLVRNPRGLTNVSQINIKLSDRSKEAEAKLAIADIIRKRHNLAQGVEDDFSIASQSDVLSTATSVESTLQVLLVSIALISLIVGGIGIMNIMLVSVSERTREIGIRKAVGAKRLDILLQFIIEALAVTIVGGILGVLVGMGAIYIARQFQIGGEDTRYVITPLWIAAGIGMSAATGLVFGVYPAWRAARLDPIEALRRE